jgi:hypothetical protein
VGLEGGRLLLGRNRLGAHPEVYGGGGYGEGYGVWRGGRVDPLLARGASRPSAMGGASRLARERWY